MNKFLLFISTLLLLSCGNKDPELMKSKLAGYWEIDKVRLLDGTERTFGMSSTIDFIEVTGDSGVRKKVVPQFDGTFLANDSAEKFDMKIENNSLILYYKTPYDDWKETVLRATEHKLVMVNEDGKQYFYKPYVKLVIPVE